MELGLRKGTVELYEHQIGWEKNAEVTIGNLKKIIGDIIKDIQHIGSTAIKTIKAKPIIDIAVGINNLDDLDRYLNELQNAGIIYRPNNIVPENKLFVIGNFAKETLTHHIHVVKYNNEQWNNYINFRDYLNANLEEAKEYEKLKNKLMEENKVNRENYTKNKEEYINRLLVKANQWKKIESSGKTCT